VLQIINRLIRSINDPFCTNGRWYDGLGYIPVDEFINLEWIIVEKVMSVKVNGDLKNGVNILKHVYPAVSRGSTVMVKKLRVIEI